MTAENSAPTPLLELEQLLQRLRTTHAIDVTQGTLTSWTTQLETALGHLKEEQKAVQQRHSHVGAAGGAWKDKAPFTFPTVIDRNKKEPRQLVHAVSQGSFQKTRNCSICILSLLEAVLHHVPCDTVSLTVPYRGHEDEFRCLVALHRQKHEVLTGCGIIRGKHTLEYAAHSTGYVLSTCPKAMLLLEDTQSEECISLMELMADPSRRLAQKRTNVARLCCPVKTGATSSSSTPPLGVLSATMEGSRAFSKEMENFLFDAATLLGTILLRCNDYTTLQAAFAKGDLREELPPLGVKPLDIPDPLTQLVYRISHNANEPTSSIRVVNTTTGKTEKLREGSPLQTVYDQMEKLQHSWFAAVRLNVELKRKCEEQDRCLAVLLSRSRGPSLSPPLLMRNDGGASISGATTPGRPAGGGVSSSSSLAKAPNENKDDDNNTAREEPAPPEDDAVRDSGAADVEQVDVEPVDVEPPPHQPTEEEGEIVPA